MRGAAFSKRRFAALAEAIFARGGRWRDVARAAGLACNVARAYGARLGLHSPHPRGRPLLALLLLLLAGPAAGHGLGFTAEENGWLNRQRAVDGTKCCDERDAHVGQVVEWRMAGGHYEVRISGVWHRVPPGRIMRHQPQDPTPWPGQALLFWSPAPHTPSGVSIWCFFPEPLA